MSLSLTSTWALRRFRTQLRPRELFAIPISILLLIGLATPALPQCVPTVLPGPDDGGVSHGLDIRADGQDLVIALELGTAVTTAQVQLLGAGHRLLSEREVSPGEAGEVLMPGVLAHGRHPQMRVRAVDGQTGELLVDEPFRPRVTCQGGSCRWRVQRDLKADGATVDRELIDAIEQLRAAGHDDALAELFDRSPALRGPLAELALAWQAGGVFEGPGGMPGEISLPPGNGLCQCSWVAIEDRSPLVESGHPTGSPPLQVSRRWSGADGRWAAQMTAFDHLTSVGPRHMTLGYQLVCGKFRGVKSRQIEIAGRPESLRLPIWSDCSAPCAPVVDHRAEARLCAATKAFGRPENRADVGLSMNANLWIDGAFVVGRSVGDQLSSQDPAGDTFHQTGTLFATRTVHGSRSSTTIHLRADAQLSIESVLSPQPYIFASMSSQTEVRIEAICGSMPPAILEHGMKGGTGGGKVIVRWGDPP